MGIALITALVIVSCGVAVYRVAATRADREAERQWFAEEEAWWALLREGR